MNAIADEVGNERLAEALIDYVERYPAERTIVSRFFALLEEWPLCLTRDRAEGHLTASAWVCRGDDVLLVHHRKLNRWLQPGGHADGDENLAAVAVKEVEEETGIELTSSLSGREIFDIDVHEIPEHGGVPLHEHFDVRFLFRVEDPCELRVSDESHAVAWVPVSEIEEYSNEESLLRMRDKGRVR